MQTEIDTKLLRLVANIDNASFHGKLKDLSIKESYSFVKSRNAIYTIYRRREKNLERQGMKMEGLESAVQMLSNADVEEIRVHVIVFDDGSDYMIFTDEGVKILLGFVETGKIDSSNSQSL